MYQNKKCKILFTIKRNNETRVINCKPKMRILRGFLKIKNNLSDIIILFFKLCKKFNLTAYSRTSQEWKHCGFFRTTARPILAIITLYDPGIIIL